MDIPMECPGVFLCAMCTKMCYKTMQKVKL
nr:MAG TPA: hypothetical protein [Caudoviricetes sp.]